MNKYKNLIIALLVAFACCLVTIPKLHKMYQINGTINASNKSTKIITSKWTDTNRNQEVAYYISWSKKPENITQIERDNIARNVWNTLKIGDSVNVFLFKDDESAYTQHSVFIEKGNFVLDFIFLIGEILLFIFFLREFFVTKK